MMFAMFFVFWRIMQILTLIPTMGMLAWFVDGYKKSQSYMPTWLLLLFIVSVLGLAWALWTLFTYHRSSMNAAFVGLIDLGFVGTFIAAVYYLSWIRNQDCTDLTSDGTWTGHLGDYGSVTVTDLDLNTDKPCAMLKASWAFGIMNIFFFFFTAILALMHGNHHDDSRSYHKRRHHHSPRDAAECEVVLAVVLFTFFASLFTSIGHREPHGVPSTEHSPRPVLVVSRRISCLVSRDEGRGKLRRWILDEHYVPRLWLIATLVLLALGAKWDYRMMMWYGGADGAGSVEEH
ncbi:uncharacterized protein MKZ38_003868 [Zalerion maritima]|uniref:Uncharacterized protein n=1 Tax=Zalerion maritima TaxID=339359 RepID=A0AAD5WQC2_9PEZI|nr:uncharacterized protein MKZ38_003868 [Zalerion maritima]